MKYYTILVAALLLASCASAGEPFPGTPNLLIKGTTTAVSEDISSHCVQGGGRIVSEGRSSMICAKPLDDSFGATMYRALLTEGSTASNPEINVQTSWAKEKGGVRLSAIAWVEHQNAFGKTTRNYLDAPNLKRNLLAGLERVQKRVENKRD